MKKELPGGSSAIDARVLEDVRMKSKAMIGVGKDNLPFLDYLLYNARAAGYRDIVIVVGEGDNFIRGCYGNAGRDNRFHELLVSYAIQKIPAGREKPLGTADALKEALLLRTDWAGQKFTVCNSDNLYSREALKLLLDTPHKGAMIDYDRRNLEFSQERIEQFAVIRKNAAGFLTRIIEKPTPEEVVRCSDVNGRVGVSMNIFRLEYDSILPFLDEVLLHPVRQEKELPVAVGLLAAHDPAGVMTIPLAEHVPDLTQPNDIASVQKYLERAFPKFSWDET